VIVPLLLAIALCVDPPGDEPAAGSQADAGASVAAQPAQAQPAPAGGAVRRLRVDWKERPSIRYGSVFRLDVEAMFQEDTRDSSAGSVDTFNLHRNRVGVSGRVGKYIEFGVERELTVKATAPGALPKSPWTDVFVNVTWWKNAQIEVGKFKVPFGLDQLTGASRGDYVYRSLGATYLAPGRDHGAMVHGRFFRRGLSYWAGAFAHDGENARSTKVQGGDETVAARVTGRPLRRLGLENFEVGTSAAVSAISDDSFEPNGLRGRTVMIEATFFPSVYVKGQRRRWEADLDWNAGPASARAEYTWVRDSRLSQGMGDGNLPDARARSWYVSGTWLLTGEPKTRPVVVARPFLRGGVGAVEVVGRYERLWFDSAGGGGDLPSRSPRAETILASGNRVVTVGINWILDRRITLQLNGIREQVEDPARSPVSSGAAFWSRSFRVQFSL